MFGIACTKMSLSFMSWSQLNTEDKEKSIKLYLKNPITSCWVKRKCLIPNLNTIETDKITLKLTFFLKVRSKMSLVRIF